MDTQAVLALLGTAAGVVSAYYAYLQHQKSRTTNTSSPLAGSPAPQQGKSWSAAVDKAIESFRSGRRKCTVELVQQKNFDKPFEPFSTSELVLHVKYRDAGDGDDIGTTHRFELKINKEGDILEMASKGKRKSDSEKFR